MVDDSDVCDLWISQLPPTAPQITVLLRPKTEQKREAAASAILVREDKAI